MPKISWLEDEPYYVENLARPLIADGYQVVLYHTLEQAWSEFDDIAASDLVLVDLIVPSADEPRDGYYGGLNLLRRLAALENPPPMMVLSVVTTEEVLEEARRYTPHILGKPTRLKDFVEKVRALVEGRDPHE